MVTRTTVTREQIARPVIDLVEKFGFLEWHLEANSTLPDTDRRLQIRDVRHLAPKAIVRNVRAALERGERLPPIVVTLDGYIVDGNTRIAAAQQLKPPQIDTLFLDEDWQGASDDVTHRLEALGAAFNARHGKGIDREEIRRAVGEIGSDPTYSATRIAALIGVTDRVVNTLLAEKRARDRAEEMGFHTNGSVKAPQLSALGRQSEHLHNEPYKALFSLVQDSGIAVTDINDLVKRVRETQSDEGAMATIAEERESRRDQIATYRASGKSIPPAAAKLRQRLGFILSFEGKVAELVEYNPALTAEYLENLRRSAAVIAGLIEAQEK